MGAVTLTGKLIILVFTRAASFALLATAVFYVFVYARMRDHEPEVLFRRVKKWATFRSVASWYLWRVCDLP